MRLPQGEPLIVSGDERPDQPHLLSGAVRALASRLLQPTQRNYCLSFIIHPSFLPSLVFSDKGPAFIHG